MPEEDAHGVRIVQHHQDEVEPADSSSAIGVVVV
jgi:hypothetical protein